MGLTEADQPLYEIKADLFKGLAHPFRIRILELLSHAPEVSVAQMLTDMDLEASHLSQHLAVLRRHRLVTSERRGSHVYYQLVSAHGAELLAAARRLLADVLQVSTTRLEQAAALPPPSPPPVQDAPATGSAPSGTGSATASAAPATSASAGGQ